MLPSSNDNGKYWQSQNLILFEVFEFNSCKTYWPELSNDGELGFGKLKSFYEGANDPNSMNISSVVFENMTSGIIRNNLTQ